MSYYCNVYLCPRPEILRPYCMYLYNIILIPTLLVGVLDIGTHLQKQLSKSITAKSGRTARKNTDISFCVFLFTLGKPTINRNRTTFLSNLTMNTTVLGPKYLPIVHSSESKFFFIHFTVRYIA